MQSAVITGAAGGLGLGIARAALADGMSVLLADIDETRLTRAAAELNAPGRVAIHPVDVTDRAAMEALAAAAEARFGLIDLVCLNAGVAPVERPFLDISDDHWDRVMRINVDGVRHGLQAFLPRLERLGSGHINATASVNGHMADAGISAYNVSKFAVVALMETLLLDLRRSGSPVDVSCLCPGPIATDLLQRAVGEMDAATQAEHEMLSRGMSATEAGRITLDGIRQGRFWIFTHPSMVRTTVRARFEAMATDGSRPPLEWPWAEILTPEV